MKLEGHTSWVTAVAFSPDGSLLASASNDKTVRLWNPQTGQEVQVLEGHTSWVTAVAFSHDGLLLASASYDATVRLWNPQTGQELRQIEVTSYITTIEFSIDNQLLLTNRGTVAVGRAEAHKGTVQAAAKSGLIIQDQWVVQAHEKLLWLPQEYRSQVSAIYDSNFAVGLSSGQVCFSQVAYTSIL